MSCIIRFPHVALLWSLLAAAMALQASAESPTGNWLEEQDCQWQASYDNEVTGPYDSAFGELKKQYAASLEALLDAAAREAKLDEAVKIRSERDRVAAGDLPPDTDPSALRALRTLRAECAKSLAKLALDRQARAKGLYDRYDSILEKNQTALTKSKRIDEALEIKARRDQLKAEWLDKVAVAKVVSPPKKDPIIGNWMWRGGFYVTVHEDGTAVARNGPRATWKFLNNPEPQRKYQFIWDSTFVDTITAASDWKTLRAKDQFGERFVIRKVP